VSDRDGEEVIARWAASHVRELISRAQAEALDVARERLQARLVDALLEAADARLAAARRDEPGSHETAAGEPVASSPRLLWVYGVVPDGAEAPAGDGVDGHPVGIHGRAGVGAIVSEVPAAPFSNAALSARLEDLAALESLARAHESVLDRAMAGGAVVPFRLCTIYSSPERLDAMLDAEGHTLRAALDRLEGMREWGVKAFVRSPVTASAADVSASGTEYLTRKRETRDADVAGREASEALVAEIHARLTERAAASAMSRPQDRRLSGREAEMVLNASYLVPTEAAEAFRELVESLGHRHGAEGIDLELTGPWPPYNFVDAPADDRDT